MKLVRPETITDAILTTNITESEAAWSAATTYAATNVVRKTIANVHQRFISAQSGNLNHDPETDDGTWWTADGATNRWAMFDKGVGNPSTRADDITVSVDLPATSRADTAALLNLSATAVQVTVTDATAGLVYDETFSLVSPSGIQDWWSYFFEPIVRLRDLIVVDLPVYAGAVIQVAVTESGATVSVGELVIGLSKSLGGTQYGASLGIQDYSLKSQDAFGNYVVVERAFAKRGNFSLIVPAGGVDEVANILTDYRATPALFIGSDAYAATAIYGFVKDWTVEIPYPDTSLCSLEIEGLT